MGTSPGGRTSKYASPPPEDISRSPNERAPAPAAHTSTFPRDSFSRVGDTRILPSRLLPPNAHRSEGCPQTPASQTAGCGARIYTIYREVDDVLVALGALLAFVLNAIIGVQMWLYWGRDPIVHKVKVEDKQEPLLSRNEKAFVERTPPHSRSGTPSLPRAGTPSLSRPGTPLSASRSGRNWSRKVD